MGHFLNEHHRQSRPRLPVRRSARALPPSRYLRPFVATGFLGAFTTYSNFAMETDLLVKNGHVGVALAYTAGSLVAGFAAVWGGVVLARVAPITRGGRPWAGRPPEATHDLAESD